MCSYFGATWKTRWSTSLVGDYTPLVGVQIFQHLRRSGLDIRIDRRGRKIKIGGSLEETRQVLANRVAEPAMTTSLLERGSGVKGWEHARFPAQGVHGVESVPSSSVGRKCRQRCDWR
jgi:hypothetical protein